MDGFPTTLLFSCVMMSLLCVPSLAQTCGTYTFTNSNKGYSNCSDLPQLSSFLHWTYHPTNMTADIAFRKTGASTSNWISWGLNPSGQQMLGSQALLAYQNSSGSMVAYTTPIVNYSVSTQSGNLSFDVTDLRAEYVSGDMIIFATLHLSSDLVSTNQVWQEGSMTSSGVPGPHPTTGANKLSVGTVDFQSATVTSTGGNSSNGNSSNDQTCGTYTFTNSNQEYSTCSNLPQLSSFLHWNYDPTNMTADIAFRKTGASTSNWISWGLNPSGQGMPGSQALLAYQNSSGSMVAYTYPIVGYSLSTQPGNLSFDVTNLRAEYVSGDMIIFATLHLSSDLVSTNQVWQEGSMTSSGVPGPHPTTGANKLSVGTVDFQSGTVTSTGGTSSRDRKRNVHGVLNAVSWGILMPVGIIIARYLKVFKVANPAWFYLHAACQTSGYAVGVGGWATGLKLGSDSPGITYNTHRKLGIIIFCLGTLQVFALLLRPKPDHKYRLYWNIYHHGLGYATVVLSIINIFEGFDVLDREKNWRKAYIGVLIFLGAVALILEAVTWLIVIKRKKSERSDKHVDGTNGTNGYGSRVQQTV